MTHWSRECAGLLDPGTLAGLATVVLAEPTPSGAELGAALRIADWGRTAAPWLQWAVQEIAPGRGTLLAWDGDKTWQETAGTWLYTHLDHTLSGDPALDEPLTGWALPPTRAVIDAERVRGLGVGVSRGPAIAALLAVRALTRHRPDGAPVGVLLTAGGTHRSGDASTGLHTGHGLGVRAALATGWRPDAVIDVKGGADGVLSAEPGNVMLQVRWQAGRATALPARGPGAGAAVVAGRLAVAVEQWRDTYRESAQAGQVAGDLCVGSVHSGLTYKTDLQPAVAVLGVYASMVPGVRGADVAEALAAHLRTHVEHGELTVRVLAEHPGNGTDEAHPLVVAARRVWDQRHGAGSSQVTGYRGSTDGVLFRAAGVPTVRFGPTAATTDDDPTVEELSTAELLAAATMYVETVAAAAGPGGAR